MILTLDVGNTQITGGLWDEDKLVLTFRRTTAVGNSSDEIGKMRNSRVVKSFDPTAIAHYEITIDNVHHLKAAAGYHYSMYSNSALNFYNAPDPRPDYYRNLPSAMWDGQIANPYNENGANQLFDETGKHYPWGNFIADRIVLQVTIDITVV